MKRVWLATLILGWSIVAGAQTDTPTPTPTFTNTATATPTTLQLYIDFENRYTDQSGVGRTVTKDGTVSYINSPRGYGGSFSTASFLTISAASPNLDGIANHTWAAWFKRADIATTINEIILKASAWDVNVDASTDGEWSGTVYDASETALNFTTTGDSAETTNWKHLAVVTSLDGSPKSVKFYLDGALISTVTTTIALMDSSVSNLFAGKEGIALDELQVWNRSLNATEVYVLAQAYTPTPTITNTPTPTKTFTPTITNTPTKTATFTNTITNTPTVTRTPTRTYTGTFTRTPTKTATPTRTLSPTRTATPTPTGVIGSYTLGVPETSAALGSTIYDVSATAVSNASGEALLPLGNLIGLLAYIEFDPADGDLAPSDNYDFTLLSVSMDDGNVFGTGGDNLDYLNSELRCPKVGDAVITNLPLNGVYRARFLNMGDSNRVALKARLIK